MVQHLDELMQHDPDGRNAHTMLKPREMQRLSPLFPCQFPCQCTHKALQTSGSACVSAFVCLGFLRGKASRLEPRTHAQVPAAESSPSSQPFTVNKCYGTSCSAVPTCKSLGPRALQSMETKSKEKASTHAHRQHGPGFIHGVAVSACTDVGIFLPWMVKAQLCSHILDEGAHPGRASTNTHKLQPENRVPVSILCHHGSAKFTSNLGVTWELPSKFSGLTCTRCI